MANPVAQVSSFDPVGNRVLAGILLVCCGGPLVLAAVLKPDASGVGTHTQMGLPSCGFEVYTGYPCATCGCTTTFAHAADGSLLSSFITQPFGALLALAMAMLTLIGGWALATGMPLAPVGQILTHKRNILFWVGLLLVAWAYKALAMSLGG